MYDVPLLSGGNTGVVTTWIDEVPVNGRTKWSMEVSCMTGVLITGEETMQIDCNTGFIPADSGFVASGVVGGVWNFDYTESPQIFTADVAGYYQFEAWGAQGGNRGSFIGGKGGYTKGTVYLTE